MRSLTALALVALCASAALAQTATPTPDPSTVCAASGTSFAVNTTTAYQQSYPSVAIDSAGGFLVTWWDFGAVQDTIEAQRFASDGSRAGTEIVVSTDAQSNGPPAVASVGSTFVVVWATHSSPVVDARRYDSQGSALSTAFRVNTTNGVDGRAQTVSPCCGGGFVVAWASYAGGDKNILAQRFDSQGAPAGTEFQVNTYATGNQRHPSIGTDSSGAFIVAWSGYGSAGSDQSSESVHAQRYDSGGAPVGTEFQVNTYATGEQYHPSIAVAPSGAFVVSWSGPADGFAARHTMSQAFAADGSRVGTEFGVDTPTGATAGYQYNLASAPLAIGFVVVWQGDTASGQNVLGAERLGSDGAPAGGGAFQIGESSADSLNYPSAATGPAGRFVAAWGDNGRDGDSYGIFAQTFTCPAAATPTPIAGAGFLAIVPCPAAVENSWSTAVADPQIEVRNIGAAPVAIRFSAGIVNTAPATPVAADLERVLPAGKLLALPRGVSQFWFRAASATALSVVVRRNP